MGGLLLLFTFSELLNRKFNVAVQFSGKLHYFHFL
jgi:hypothetical protein